MFTLSQNLHDIRLDVAETAQQSRGFNVFPPIPNILQRNLFGGGNVLPSTTFNVLRREVMGTPLPSSFQRSANLDAETRSIESIATEFYKSLEELQLNCFCALIQSNNILLACTQLLHVVRDHDYFKSLLSNSVSDLETAAEILWNRSRALSLALVKNIYISDRERRSFFHYLDYVFSRCNSSLQEGIIYSKSASLDLDNMFSKLNTLCTSADLKSSSEPERYASPSLPIDIISATGSSDDDHCKEVVVFSCVNTLPRVFWFIWDLQPYRCCDSPILGFGSPDLFDQFSYHLDSITVRREEVSSEIPLSMEICFGNSISNLLCLYSGIVTRDILQFQFTYLKNCVHNSYNYLLVPNYVLLVSLKNLSLCNVGHNDVQCTQYGLSSLFIFSRTFISSATCVFTLDDAQWIKRFLLFKGLAPDKWTGVVGNIDGDLALKALILIVCVVLLFVLTRLSLDGDNCVLL